MPLSPFDWPGEPFLVLYVALFVLMAGVSVVGAALCRPGDGGGAITDAAELAFLAGGTARWLDAAVAGKLADGTLVMVGRDRFADRDGRERDWSSVRRDLAPAAARVERALRAIGLLVRADALPSLRRWAAWPFAALLAFGAIKLLVGIERDRPVGYLAALLVVTAAAAILRWTAVDQRTPAGRAALARARDRHDRLRRAPTRGEMALGVALFGTTVLSGSAYAAYHQLRAGSSDTSSSSDGGGCGDGGGGCGGCGS